MRFFPTGIARRIAYKVLFSKIGFVLHRSFRLQSIAPDINHLTALSKQPSKSGLKNKAVFEKTVSRCFLLPASREDGVGIQAMIRINTMFLARQVGASYIHVPFSKLAHQNSDPDGASTTSLDYAGAWEQFFNFGKDELDPSHWSNVIGNTKYGSYLSREYRRVGRSKYAFLNMLPCLVKELQSTDRPRDGAYAIDLGICTLPVKEQIILDRQFVADLKEKFDSNGFQPENELFDKRFLDIAIHIRRGDAWNAIRQGSEDSMYVSRVLGERYYVDLIRKLYLVFRPSEMNVRYHIFTDGREDDFEYFIFTGEGEASLNFDSNIRVENIHFHCRSSSREALHHMIKAPVLVPGKSTFSVVAALLNDSFIFYPEEVCEFYQYRSLEKLIDDSPRHIRWSNLDDQIDNVIAAFK